MFICIFEIHVDVTSLMIEIFITIALVVVVVVVVVVVDGCCCYNIVLATGTE